VAVQARRLADTGQQVCYDALLSGKSVANRRQCPVLNHFFLDRSSVQLLEANALMRKASVDM
jgi:hypothetical protein